jgi:hypothetical protein
VGFVVEKVASGQVSSKYFGFPAKTIHSTNFSILMCKRKIEVPPTEERSHVTPFKGAKGSRASKLAKRNVDF